MIHLHLTACRPGPWPTKPASGRAEVLTGLLVLVKAALVVATAVQVGREAGRTGEALAHRATMQDLTANVQTEMRAAYRRALDTGKISRAQYEIAGHKIDSYRAELQGLAARLTQEQGFHAVAHSIKGAIQCGAQTISAKWTSALGWHAAAFGASGQITSTAGARARQPIVQMDDVKQTLGPLQEKFRAPEDAFARARVAARVRSFIDHARQYKMPAERRRQWIANFIQRLEHEGWDKVLPGVMSREDLKRFVADEARRYFAADKVLRDAGLDAKDENFAKVRRRLLDEMAGWEMARVRDERALRKRLAEIRDEVRRGVEPDLKGLPPVAVISCSKTTGKAPLKVRFVGVASKGKNLSYSWEITSLGTVGGAVAEHAFGKPGRYPVRLTVVDKAGRRSVAEKTIKVCNRGPVRVTVDSVTCTPEGALQGAEFEVAVTATLSGLHYEVSAAVGGTISALGQVKNFDLGSCTPGTHQTSVLFKIPSDAPIGKQPVTATARVTTPDEELYGNPGNQLTARQSGSVFVRDPFLGIWKGSMKVEAIYPERRVGPARPITFTVERKGPGTLSVVHSDDPAPQEVGLNGRVGTCARKDDLFEERTRLVFDGETLTVTAQATWHTRDVRTKERKVKMRCQAKSDLRRVWHPGEGPPPQ